MKTTLTATLIALSLTACGENPNRNATDQCLRVQLFQQCMTALPAGPVSTQYNDWDEVVEKCDSVALYQSYRPTVTIKHECRAY
jgi:hypothetical protein